MRTENAVVNLAGPVQGITLTTVPAASSILSVPTGCGLSSSQYGAMGRWPFIRDGHRSSRSGTGLAAQPSVTMNTTVLLASTWR